MSKSHPLQKLLVAIPVFALLIFALSACQAQSPEAPPPAAETQPPAPLATETTGLVEEMPPTQTAAPTNTPLPPTVEPAPTETPAPTAEPTPANIRVWEADGMEQIRIPAGEFIMGGGDISAQQEIGNGIAYPEVPQFTMNLDEFWIDKYEVTNQQYALCVAAGGCKPPKYNASRNRVSYYDNPEFANYPVIYVSWYQANDYCKWAGKELLTEAQWEKAARGSDGRLYAWGDDPITSEKANFCSIGCPRSFANPAYDDGYPETAPVGSFPAGASAYGVLDMAGNVWEWTRSVPGPYPYDPNDGRENPDAYDHRIWRGGAWSTGVWYLRASTRYHSVQKYQYHNLGIRCGASE